MELHKNLLLIGLTFTKHSPIMCACKEQDGSLVKVYELNMQFPCKINPEKIASQEKFIMQKKKENFRPLRSVTTFALAAAIITGSIYTVAAA